MRMLRTPPYFPPKSREKPYLEVLSRFGLWRDFLGRVVRKPVNANPGLKVNRSNNFSSIKMLSTAYVLCSLRLLMLKTEGQKI